jgi:hypothetical protein
MCAHVAPFIADADWVICYRLAHAEVSWRL